MSQQNVNDIQNSIYQAVEIIAQNAITRAGFDKTITAYIDGEENNGIYSVRYQDATFTASTDNLNTHYPLGTAVYVLVPNGDFSKNKKIIGTVQNLGELQTSETQEQNPFFIIGSNCISPKVVGEEYVLSSHAAAENQRISIQLYDINNIGDSLVNVDQTAFKEYMKSSQDIQFSASFKNLFAESQQTSYGNYGLSIVVEVIDPADDSKIYNKICKLTTDNMDGNPYVMTDYHNYVCSYNVGPGCSRILSIELFAENFEMPKFDIPDIFVTNISVYAQASNIEKASDLTLTITSPNGLELSKSQSKNQIELIANLAYKGKTISNPNIETYWFMEDASVTTQSIDYNPYGGQGWCCLNDYPLPKKSDMEILEKHWVPNTSLKYIIDNKPLSEDDIRNKKRKSTTKRTKYKCVCCYQNQTVSSTVIVINQDANYDIKIESSQGTLFKANAGVTDLICQFNALQEDIAINYDKIKYQWSVLDSTGVYLPIETSGNEVSQLIQDITLKQTMLCNIYEEIVNASGNVEELLLGTGSIDLVKIIEADSNQNYILSTINNNGYVFKYDANGRSPASSKNIVPLKLSPLSFKLFNHGGAEIVNDRYSRWLIPAENTMLDSPKIITHVPEGSEEKLTPIENGYYVIKDEENLVFNIKEYFDSKYKNNSILLEVTYQGYVFKASFDFNFIKDGDIGTNGTDFYCEITPNTKIEYEGYPILYFYADTIKKADSGRPYDLAKQYWVSFNWDDIKQQKTINNQSWFSATLYKQGVAIPNDEKISWNWSILSNPIDKLEYNALSIDEAGVCSFTPGQTDEETGYWQFNYMDINSHPDKRPNLLNIQAEATYEGRTYYSVFPVICAWMKNLDYALQIEDGCREVMYNSDKSTPQFSPSPFVFSKREKNIGEWEIIDSLVHSQNKTYGTDFSFDFEKNVFTPVDYYNGEVGYNQIHFVLSGIADVYFPLYFYLNRYGHAAINGWNGNSISLNNKDIILAPQMGAGKKDADNTFTGVLMGTVKHADSTEETGLLAYKAGTRTFFLNAEDGSASFGDGAIRIQPTGNKSGSMLTVGGWNVTDKALYKGNEYLGAQGTNVYLGEDGFSLGDQLVFNGLTGELKIKGGAIEWTNDSIKIDQLGEWQINAKGRFLSDYNGATVVLQPPSEEIVFAVQDFKITRDGKLYLNGDSALFIDGKNVVDLIQGDGTTELKQQVARLTQRVTELEKDNKSMSDELIAIKDRLQRLEDAK